ncbi:MAG: fibronectin type III domain-containing protein [Spirochaetaceae bacterium]|jgi:hypothetical protein|nr:fibronectin type III domain-containing protein [Spirochaetaceae bacterium]
MKRNFYIALLGMLLLLPVFAEGEKTLTLGSDEGWRRIARMDGVEAQAGLRPKPVLMPVAARDVLAMAEIEKTEREPGVAYTGNASDTLDLALHFDEMDPRRYRDAARHYTVNVSDGVYSAPLRWAYSGSGAAVFDKNGAAFVTVKSASPNALLSDNNRIGSFSIEFFLFPRVVESNAEIFLWNAAVAAGQNQFVRAAIVRGRVSLIFDGFFRSADNTKAVALRLSSNKALVPDKYSHHLIRFDRDTGLIEYLVDGTLEDVRYTTENSRESGGSNEIYEPYTGKSGELIIGKGFNGIIDEFNLYSSFIETVDTARYSAKPGLIESETIDLGTPGATVLRLLATGGYTAGINTGGHYTGSFGVQSGAAHAAAETFPDSSAIQLFIRAQDEPYGWEHNEWRAVLPGAALDVNGRYVQLSAAFYPSADRSGAPYLSSLSLVYKTVEPPAPPAQIIAAAGDGFVDLSWKKNGQPEVGGYLIYIGTKSGEYWERSPIDAGNAASLHVDGLKNGVLYYFSISSYTQDSQVAGIFSKEIRARPLLASR